MKLSAFPQAKLTRKTMNSDQEDDSEDLELLSRIVAEMDFHSMKRRELQALCKKHSIPANLTNLEMANKLTSLLKVKEKPKTRGRSCLKGLDEIESVDNSDVVNRPKKKVKFSPDNEMFEYSKSVPREKRRMARRSPKSLAVQNVDRFESNEEFVENPIRVTRSRTHSLVEDDLVSIMNPPMEKKRGKKSVRKVVDLYDNSVDEEAKVSTRRLLRNREVVDTGVVSVQNPVGKRGRKRGIDRIDEPQSSVVVLSVKSKTDVETEIEVQTEDDGVHQVKEPLRRSGRSRKSLMPRAVNEDKSQRNGKKAEESEILNGDLGKVEPGRGKITRARAQLGVKVSAVGSKSITETQIGVQRGAEVLNIEEQMRQTGRNNNRRKSIIPRATNEDKVGVPQIEAPPTRNVDRRKSVLPQVEKVKADGLLIKYNRRSRARKQVSFEDEKTSNIMVALVENSASKSSSLQTENREQEMEISVKENLDMSPEGDIEKSVQTVHCGTKEVDDDLLSNSPQKTGEKYGSNSSFGRGKVKDLNGAGVARFALANPIGDGSLDQMDSTVEPEGTQTEKELEGWNGIDEPAMRESVIGNCSAVSNESGDSKKEDGNVSEAPREATFYDPIEEVRITSFTQENKEIENTETFVEAGESNEPSSQKRIQHIDVEGPLTNKILTIEEPIAPNAVILSLPEEGGPVDQVKKGKMTAQFLNSNGDANCSEEAVTASLSGTLCLLHDIGKSFYAHLVFKYATGGNNDKMDTLVPQELSSCKQRVLKYAENDGGCQSKNSESAPDDCKETSRFYSSNKEISATETSKEREIDDIKDSADNAQASLLGNSEAFEGNIENESSARGLGCVGLAPLEQKIVLEDQDANDSGAAHVCQTGMLELQTTKYGEIAPIPENLECDANIRISSEEITEKVVITTEKEHQSSVFVDIGLSCHKNTSLDETEECVNLNNPLGTPVNNTYTNKEKTSSQDILMSVDEDNKMEALVPQELSSYKQTLLKHAENGHQSKNSESAPDDCKCSSMSYSSNKEKSATEMSKEREIDVIKDSADNAQASLVVNSEAFEGNIENESSACSLGCVGLAPLEPKFIVEDQEANDSGTINACQTGMLELLTTKYAEISPVRENLECGANIVISSEEITEEAVITTEKDHHSSVFVDIGLSCHKNTSLEDKDESEECVNLNNLLGTPVNSTHTNKGKTSSQDILMSVDEDNKMVKEKSESEHENNIPMATTYKESIDKSSSGKEQEYQLNHLFASPFGRSNPCRQEASSHEKVADVAMSPDKTTSKIICRNLSAVESQEMEGAKVNEHERSIHKQNVMSPADEEINDDGNHDILASQFWNSNGDNNGSNMTMQYPSNTTEEAITSPLSGTDCFLQDIGGNNDNNKVLLLQEQSSCKQTMQNDAAVYPASKDDKYFVNMERYLVELAEYDDGCQSKNGKSAPGDSIETSPRDSSNKEREIDDIKHSVDTAQASHFVNAETFARNEEVQNVAMEVVVPEELSLRKQTRLMVAVADGVGEENKVFIKAEHNLVELAKFDEGCQLKGCEGTSDNSIKTAALDFANGERSAKQISQEGENDHARDSIETAAVPEHSEISHVLSNQVGDLSAQINSEDSDNERAENLNILVVAPESSLSVHISISSYLHSALKGSKETEQGQEIAVSMDKDSKKVQNERFNQSESEEMVGAGESEPEKDLQLPTICEEDTNKGPAESEKECHLNLLFATPVSRENHYKEEENSSHEKMTDRRMSLNKNDSKVESGKFSCGECQEIVEPKANGHERSIHEGNTTSTADERLDGDEFKILSSTPVSNKINKESESYGFEEITDVALTVEKTNNEVGHLDTQEMLRGEITYDCEPKENWLDDHHNSAKRVISPSLSCFEKGNANESSTNGEIIGGGMHARWHEEVLKNLFATPVSDEKGTVSDDNSLEVSNEKLRSAVMEASFYNEDAKDVAAEVNNEAILKSNELGSCEGEEAFVQIPASFEGTTRHDEVDCDDFASQGKEIILEQGGEVEISKKISVEGSLSNLKNNELGFCESENNKGEVGPEMALGASTGSETVNDREGEEDFVQFSAYFEGTMQQVHEDEFDGQGKEFILEQGGDLSSDKVILGDREVEISKNMSVEGCLSIGKSSDLQEKRDDSYLQVSAQGLDSQLENDKVVKIDNFSQSRVPYREEGEEEPNQFGDLNVHAEGKDITEVTDYELNEFKGDTEVQEPNAQGEMTEVLEDRLNEFPEDKEEEHEPQEYDGGPNVDAQEKEMPEVPDNDINEFEGIATEDVKLGGSIQRENQATEAMAGTSPSTRRFYSTTMKMKTVRTNLIRGTPSKLLVDMKENAQSLRREMHTSNKNAAKSVTKRRALGQL
ncbi:hypothetical protein LguiB_017640 [Lonicera macranthoides]